jgi:hypothetical protein
MTSLLLAKNDVYLVLASRLSMDFTAPCSS